MVERLDQLLQSCTVKITVPGQMGWGTGFFVAPGLILTCAHVVKALKPDETAEIAWQSQEKFAQATIAQLIPEFDLALLQVSPPPNPDLPCVYLDGDFQPTDNFYTYGYPDSFPDGASVTSQCEGDALEKGVPLILFKSGLIRPGFSGSPLLNLRTGKVCGIVKFTRDRSIELGGGAIPTRIVLEQFPQLQALQQQFHEGDRRWTQLMGGGIATNSATPPATKAALSLSAYDAATWVGRESLITMLSQKLQDGCRILILAGITGIGKTALAERLVVEVSGNGIPFHRLNFDDRGQGHDFLSGALSLLPKLEETVTTDDQKDPQNALHHLLQTLRNKQFLIQIDSLEMVLQGDDQTGWNAFSDSLWMDFLQQILAGEFCQSQLLLTTQAMPEELEEVGSRYLRYWHRQDLSGLSDIEQLQLFEKNGLKPDGPGVEILERIGQLYQGHPLVIQVIAKDILDKPFNGNVQQYWQRYQNEFDEMEKSDRKGGRSRALQLRVKQRVERSLKGLPTDAYQMLCRSSVYRQPVPEEFWVIMLGDVSEEKHWIALELLKSRNLAEQELRTDGILLLRQHNLVRSVAIQFLKMDEAAWREAELTAANVWLNHYKSESDASDLKQIQGSLEAFYHYCKVEEWKAAKIILIDQEVGNRLRAWGKFREMLSLYGQLIGKVDASVDILCEKGVGNAYWFLSNYPAAIKHSQQGLAIAQRIGDRRGEETALGDLGYAYYGLSDYHQAIECHQQRLTIAREIGYRNGEETALAGLGMVHAALGNYTDAIECQQQSLKISREIGDRNGEGNALGCLGNIYCLLGQYPEAIECQKQLLKIAQAIGKRRGEGNALGNLGNIYSSMGNYSQAIECYQKCLTIAREAGQRRDEGLTLVNWGTTLIKLEQYSEAQQHLQTALDILKGLGERNGEAHALQNLAELYQHTGQITKAQKYCDRALSLASELGIPLVKECQELQALLAECSVEDEP